MSAIKSQYTDETFAHPSDRDLYDDGYRAAEGVDGRLTSLHAAIEYATGRKLGPRAVTAAADVFLAFLCHGSKP